MKTISIERLGRLTVDDHRRIDFVDSAPDGRVIATGHTSEKSGTITADLELVVDLQKLLRMVGQRAISSKGRRVKLQAGAIVVRVVKGTESRTEIPHVHGTRCYSQGKLVCKIGEA